MNRKRFLITLLLLGLTLSAAARKSNQPRDPNVERLKSGTSETLSAAAALAAETKDQAQSRLQKEMKRLDVNLQDLKQRASRAGEEAKARFEAELPNLERRKAELTEKLEDLKDRSGKAWDDLATGTESALHELRKSFEKAKSHF
jgi:hypothetical protein